MVGAIQSNSVRDYVDLRSKSVLVIDIGSSTTDFAYINKGRETEIHTGGEVSLWTSIDEGKSWTRKKQMTVNSPRNHCYPRRPINAHPDFYAIWADGNGREPSESNIFFCDIEGNVFRLPRQFDGDAASPIDESL